MKKVLNQPNLVGTMLIALMVCGGFVYAFAFDGFNVETATGSEVEAWLAAASSGSSSGSPSYTCDSDMCTGESPQSPGRYWNCPARGTNASQDCTGCSRVTNYCRTKPKCSKGHHGTCRDTGGCPYGYSQPGSCSNAINPKTGKTQTTCPPKCKG